MSLNALAEELLPYLTALMGQGPMSGVFYLDASPSVDQNGTTVSRADTGIYINR